MNSSESKLPNSEGITDVTSFGPSIMVGIYQHVQNKMHLCQCTNKSKKRSEIYEMKPLPSSMYFREDKLPISEGRDPVRPFPPMLCRLNQI